MHWIVVLAGLTACYQSGTEAPCTVLCGAAGECPDGLTCNTTIGRCALKSGSCGLIDASPVDIGDSPDAPIDSLLSDGPVALCSPGNPISTTTLTQGRWFIADRPTMRAVKFENQGVLVTDVPDTMTSPDWVDAFTGIPAATGYDAPRLAVAGTEMFVTQQVGGVYSIARSTRENGVWTLPSRIDLMAADGLTPIPVVGTSVVSAPTNSAPRFMLFTSGSPASLLGELVEETPMRWRRVNSHPLSYGNVTYLGHGTLSENGLRMVFTGQDGAAIVAGYYVDRPNGGAQFQPPAIKLNAASTVSVETPYLTADCKHYYYSDPNSGFIQHVTYP